MKRVRARMFLAFMFLVMAQYACDRTGSVGVISVISYTVEAFAYEDLNANGSQEPNETGMEGIQIYLGDSRDTTRQDGKITFVAAGDEEPCPISYSVTPPTGYKVTAQTNPSWNCTKNTLGLYVETSQFASTHVGVAPIITITILKTASPTTFSAAGETITYTYTVTNLSTLATPSPLELRDDKLGVITCPKKQLSSAETMTCTTTSYITTDADVARGSITNIASIYYKGVQFSTTKPVTVTLVSSSSSQPQPPAPTLSSPVLTGQFATFCDPNRAISFTIVEGVDTSLVSSELSAGNLILAINEQDISGSCKVTSDGRLLYCRYPSGITKFPTQIVLSYKGTSSLETPFYGEVCTNTSTNSSSGGGQDNNPSPTACQVDPTSFDCYCENNPGDPYCPFP